MSDMKNKVKLVVFWIIVASPLIWGISQTIVKSLALFGN